MSSKLVAQNLYKNFLQGEKELSVLRGVNIEVEQGCSCAIVGVSGSGKSTFMHILGGLDTPNSGTVLFNNQDLFKLKSSKKENFLNKELGFIFQFHYLIKELSVLENIMLMGLIGGENKACCKTKAENLLTQVGMIDKADSYPTQLSGGQLQRAAILRAIFNKPAFLLADEPTGDLDSLNAKNIIDILLQYSKEWNMGIVICSHDEAVYSRMDKIFRLHNGILIQEK